jgi:hypothetical protein
VIARYVCLNLLTLSLISVKSSKSRRCVLPNAPAHPRTLRGTIQGQVTVAPFPRDRKTGHDPSLGAPMPGHHRAWPGRWSKPSALRPPVTGSQTPNCSLPFIVTSRCAGSFSAFALCSQCLSNNVSVCKQQQQLRTVLRQRVATMSHGAVGSARVASRPTTQRTSHIPSAHEQFNCYVVPHLQ